MSVVVGFLVVLALIAGWWLSRQGIAAKPWLQVDQAGAVTGSGTSGHSAMQVGLGVFMAVVGSLFALLIAGYLIRSDMADWRDLPLPWIVWPNTLPLLGASLALEWALTEANRGALERARVGVLLASLSALVFLFGQFTAWRMLVGSGYFVNSGPAGSFFYLMTAAHGLHIIGGMVALARSFAHIHDGERPDRIRQSIELCAIYWLFMLFIWGILLLVLSGRVSDFVSFCGQILSQGGLS